MPGRDNSHTAILLYHRIDLDADDPWGICTAPENFAAHLEYLKQNFDVVPLSALVERLQRGSSVAGLACITFDDGYESIHSTAAPLLSSTGFSATFFLNSNFLDREAFWWDRLQRILCGLKDAGKPAGSLKEIWNGLRNLPCDERESALAYLGRELLGEPDTACPLVLSSEQVVDLARSGFEIGAHTRSHPRLPALTSDEVLAEIRGSVEDLGRVLGQPVQYFSYPFGHFDDSVRSLVARSGIRAALAVGGRSVTLQDDRLALPRIDAKNRTVEELRALLSEDGPADAARIGAGAASQKPAKPGSAGRSGSKGSKGGETAVQASAADTVAVGRVDFGDFARTRPISNSWGRDRGTPIDRVHIETFLRRHGGDIFGQVLEIKDRKYSRMFGAESAQVDVLDIDPENAKADIIGSIETGETIPDCKYDCIVLTQVLQLVYDLHGTVATLHRILKPGGVLLATVSGITRARKADGIWYWSFHEASVRRLLAEKFDPRKLLVEPYGNLVTAISFLGGLAAEEIPPEHADVQDGEYPIVITARATKESAPMELAAVSLPALARPPLVSIIMPLFNAQGTVGEAIESVLRQTVTDWELLIADDGSTDASYAEAQRYADTFPDRIFIWSHPDKMCHGASAARNVALEHARGALISFLDADDTWLPQKLAIDVATLNDHDEAAGVVGPALWWWDDSSGRSARIDRVATPWDTVHRPPELFRSTYLDAIAAPPCTMTWTFRREALAAIEPFDRALPTYEDQRYLAELCLRYPIYVSSQCLGEYRRTDNSLWQSTTNSGQGAIDRQNFRDWVSRAATSELL